MQQSPQMRTRCSGQLLLAKHFGRGLQKAPRGDLPHHRRHCIEHHSPFLFSQPILRQLSRYHDRPEHFAHALAHITPMSRAIRRAATSLLIIVSVACAARLTFAWYQTRQIPREVLRTVPFQTETRPHPPPVPAGKGFSSPYERDSGPTAILPPVYPLIVATLFKIFGIYS